MPPLSLPFRCGKATITLVFLLPPRPQAVALFAAASTATILRTGCASATAAAPVSPSPCLYRQNERLAITSGVSLGSGRPASVAELRQPHPDALTFLLQAPPRPQAVALFFDLFNCVDPAHWLTPALLQLHRYRPRPAFIGSANGWPLGLGWPWAPVVRLRWRSFANLTPTPLLICFKHRPGHKPWLCLWPLQLRRSCALAAPALLLLHRYRPRPAFIGSANGWPLRLGWPWAPGVRPRWRSFANLTPTPLLFCFKHRPGHKPWLCLRPLQLRRSCALAAPALLLLHRCRPRPAFIGSANG